MRIISVLSLIFSAWCAAAQSPSTYIPEPVQDTVRRTIDIENISVTARGVREVVPSQVLSGRELERLGTHSVADALRYFAGVQIKDYGGIGGLKTINVRSMGSHHVGVFYDGVQISNAQNGTVDLGKFSLDNMEMVSVHNGQKSDVFQSARDFASASAVYMVSRRPVFSDGKRSNLNFKMKGGSFALANPSVLWEHRVGEGLSLSANAEFLYTDGRYKYRYSKTGGYDVTEIRRNGDVTSLRAEAAAFGTVRSGVWQAKAYFYNSRRGYPGAAVKKDEGIALLNEDRQADRNFFLQGSLKQDISGFYSYQLKAKYANDYMNYVMPAETTTLKPADNHFHQQEVYLASSHLFTLTDGWTVNLAADLQYNRLDARALKDDVFNTNFPEPRRITLLGAAATSLRLGKVDMQGSLLYTWAHDESARGFATAADTNELTPTFIISYRPWYTIGLDLRAFYKDIFRMPTFNDLYYVQLGNRSLKPEYTRQYNAGAAYRKFFGGGCLSGISLTADIYYNQVRNKIIATPTSNQLVWTMVNLGYVEIRGLDAGADLHFRIGKAALRTSVKYTFQKAQDFTEDDRGSGETVLSAYGDQIPYVPLHSGTLVLSGEWRQWDFSYSFIYTGERYMLGGNIPVNYIQPWYTSDFSLSRNFHWGASRMRVTAEVNNIFNQQYEVVKWYPMPGTNFKIIVSLTL